MVPLPLVDPPPADVRPTTPRLLPWLQAAPKSVPLARLRGASVPRLERVSSASCGPSCGAEGRTWEGFDGF